jgi:PAS domain S-box-containing protein
VGWGHVRGLANMGRFEEARGRDGPPEGIMAHESTRPVAGRSEETRQTGRYFLIAFAAIATALIPAISAWALMSLRAQAIADAETQTSNLAHAFASHATRTIGEFTKDVDATVRALDQEGVIRDDNEQFLHLTLRTYLASSPQILNAFVANAEGKVIAGLHNNPERRIDISDRSYFVHHKANPSPDILLGAPVRGRILQRVIVTVSRRLATPSGRFLGVLATSLSPEYFSNFYSTVALGEGGVVELINDSGTVVARFPATAALIGQTSDAWEQIRSLPRGAIATTYRMEHPSDHIERIASVAAAEDYPLLVQVAVGMPHVLASWRTQLYRQGAATLLAMLAVLLFTAGLLRAYARLVESERAERRQAQILNTTISSMADAILVADETGKILIANPAAKQVFGNRDDIGSEDWARSFRLLLPDGMPFPRDRTPIAQAVRGEAVDNVEMVLQREGVAEPLHLVANGRPLREAGGALKGAVVVYRDVTAAKETERQLRQAQKMDAVGQLTGGIAHDFNNILTVITGTIEILVDAVAERPQLAAVAKMISDAAERAAELTQRLLAFARRQPLQPCETDINALVVETAKLLRPTLGEHVEIESMLEDAVWPALVDRSQLATALLNLAINARDAMPSGGKLTIETANVVLDESYARIHGEVAPGPYVLIAVSDTGTGIPKALRDRVFEPFFTTKAVGKGTGLGLSMVYGFVKQSGGHIKLYSEEGYGTSIKIYLPRASQYASRQVSAVAAIAPTERGSETVLVVEDDSMVRNYVIAQLESLGYATLSAANGGEALALIHRGAKFQLLFTDVIMSGSMNGRQLAEEILRIRPSSKVLFTSGYTENAIFHHGRLDPGVLLLAKPYRKVDLARMVRIALDAVEPLPISAGAGRSADRRER